MFHDFEIGVNGKIMDFDQVRCVLCAAFAVCDVAPRCWLLPRLLSWHLRLGGVPHDAVLVWRVVGVRAQPAAVAGSPYTESPSLSAIGSGLLPEQKTKALRSGQLTVGIHQMWLRQVSDCACMLLCGAVLLLAVVCSSDFTAVAEASVRVRCLTDVSWPPVTS